MRFMECLDRNPGFQWFNRERLFLDWPADSHARQVEWKKPSRIGAASLLALLQLGRCCMVCCVVVRTCADQLESNWSIANPRRYTKPEFGPPVKMLLSRHQCESFATKLWKIYHDTAWQVQMPGAERLFRVDIRTLKIFTSTWAAWAMVISVANFSSISFCRPWISGLYNRLAARYQLKRDLSLW